MVVGGCLVVGLGWFWVSFDWVFTVGLLRFVVCVWCGFAWVLGGGLSGLVVWLFVSLVVIVFVFGF